MGWGAPGLGDDLGWGGEATRDAQGCGGGPPPLGLGLLERDIIGGGAWGGYLVEETNWEGVEPWRNRNRRQRREIEKTRMELEEAERGVP